LRARLADARFFWDQDRKLRLEDRVEALKTRVYHDRLGTMYDKAERMEKLAGFLAVQLYSDPRRRDDGGEVSRLARRAAHLAKADLSTGMVGEFPELQGVMGRYYALHDGEDRRVADAIAEHYKPLGPNDSCPTAPVSIVVALADKIDALAAFFAVGEKPTGSRDPFALRRAAQGTIRLILENELRLSLRVAFGHAAATLGPGYQPATADLLAFIADRLKVHLREQGVRHDLIAAVFALGEDDLLRLLGRVHALQQFLNTQDGANLLIAYRRAANIVAIEERRDGRTYDPQRLLLGQHPAETALDAQLLGLENQNLASLLEAGLFAAAMGKLAALRQWVDDFFAKVTVNTDDPALRENRLRLLSRIRAVMNQVADFSQIEG
jgi:glycyl-tRNA synthetase beta chain